ncbi:hypothetical protein [Yersinia phage fHe-Yen9-04]|uniref:Uncharacterized protein n=1 Tax=Yersinia phage fHe-Yen9-04 TaxID=2052742 RepID=A0A2C9CWZ8_9CAUD|nr:hypothetical protein FDJ41_gp036 [Yersinia phage fHe-Yen9-04]SOK58313.1 hypothetical protein [Yersinia phage fHe-Yen9-04]VUE36082.1 hypothetical protein [Yersinia phage fHe-Yen9-04]
MTNTVIVGDTYIKENKLVETLIFSLRIIPLLKRSDELFMSINKDLEYSFDSTFHGNEETYTVIIKEDRYINISASYVGDNGYTFNRPIIRIQYQDIDSSTNIGITYFTYSPLHKSFTIDGNNNYVVPRPFVHDEAWYFQKLTQHDLYPESWYIHGSNLMNKLMDLDGNFVYMRVQTGFDEEELQNISNILDLMEIKNAKHN